MSIFNVERAENTEPFLSEVEALQLLSVDEAVLLEKAQACRDIHHFQCITYSKKVFIPLTYLCRDVCHYCTFAKTPKNIDKPFMLLDEVIEQVELAQKSGCKEILFTLGEKPELRYNAAKKALSDMGFASTLDYVAHVAKKTHEATGLLPHINAGCMTDAEIAMLRPVSASMGIMLESAASRLCEKGMPHYGSPDKDPKVRLATLDAAGKAQVPFTTGILIGIGETRQERIESLLAIRKLHLRYGHIQEIIIQNFRAKPNTQMAQAVEPDLADLLWTIAVARLIFGSQMHIQAPPNLSPGVLPQLVKAGLDDWGGVSPVTPDFVNPEAPWPHVDKLAEETLLAGKTLQERLTIYPEFASHPEKWLDPAMQTGVLQMVDAQGFPRTDDWQPGSKEPAPVSVKQWLTKPYKSNSIREGTQQTIKKILQGEIPTENEVSDLFKARGSELGYLFQKAHQLRCKSVEKKITYVVNRNINYTNICYFKCQFCAFSKGKLSENLRGKPYDLGHEEITRRVKEAWNRGATEVCLQGGIHPEYTGETYLAILDTVKKTAPDIHIHAFSPLEVWQGAQTLGLSLKAYLTQLKQQGLNTLPGTAAEILDDEVRDVLCPDKINTSQWLEVMETAHSLGIKTTATIMYGHIEKPIHWARHLLRIRQLQEKTGGFTEFVPLPFVAQESPIYLKGNARKGPTFREALLMHAIARLVLYPAIKNIQTSWVKMGDEGVKACLQAGVNDLGGTLMNESITRAAGALHGQERTPKVMEQWVETMGYQPLQRTTLYNEVSEDRRQSAYNAVELTDIVNTPASKYERAKSIDSAEPLIITHH